MGFDNECILNIQSLPGEYFCPVCRTLVFPNEAMQTQCTHLYCKPCLAYVVATTRACPYDGYLVTDADAKPLNESNKSVADAINNIQVHCLYHRSGCQWQGSFSDCITHCADCSFGNSPVVCNRCHAQIIHRQVQEHAQICSAVQPQAQQTDNAQPQASAQQTQVVSQAVGQSSQDSSSQNVTAAAAVSTSVPAVPPVSVVSGAPISAATSVPGQDQTLSGAYAQSQTGAVAAAASDQWYQQQLQYQQYYQQYPGYDPYQQQYQQQAQSYYPQGQAHPTQIVQGQQQPQPYVYPQPQALPPPQSHPQPQTQQVHPQPHVVAQPQPQVHGHLPQMQAPVNPQQQGPTSAQQPRPTIQPQSQPASHGQVQSQQAGYAQGVYAPAQAPQLQAPHSQYQQPLTAQLPSSQIAQPHSQPYAQQQPSHQPPQQHPQPHPLPQHLPPTQMQGQPYAQHPSAQAVTGHHSYPQPQQQVFSGAPQQIPVHNPQQQGGLQQPQYNVQPQGQFPPQQPPQMRPLQSNVPVQAQQVSMVPSLVVPPSNQPPLHPGQPPVQQQGFPSQQAQAQLYPQQYLRPQGSPHVQPGVVHLQSQSTAPRPPYAQSSGISHLQHPATSPAAPLSTHNLYTGPSQLSIGQQAVMQSSSIKGATLSSSTVGPGVTMAGKASDSLTERNDLTNKSQDNAAGQTPDMKEPSDSNLASKSSNESADIKINKLDGQMKVEKSEFGDVEKNVAEVGVEGKDKKEDAFGKLILKEETDGKKLEHSPGRPESLQTNESFIEKDHYHVQDGKDNKLISTSNEIKEKEKEGLHQKDLILQHNMSHGMNLPPRHFQGPSPSHHGSFPPAEMLSNNSVPYSLSLSTVTNDRQTQQAIPYGSQFMQNNVIPQRQPTTDRMLQQHMPHTGPGLGGRLLDAAPTQLQQHGTALAPNLTRPPLQGFSDMPHQRLLPVGISDPSQPAAKQGLPPCRPDSQGGFPGSGLPSHFSSGPGHFGPPKNFEQPGIAGSTPPFHPGAAISHMDTIPGLPFQGPPRGVPDVSTGMLRPVLEGPLGRNNPRIMEHDAFPKVPSFFNAMHHEPRPPVPMEHGSLKMNGIPDNIPEQTFYGLSEGRLRPFPEDRFVDERMRPFPVGSGRGAFDKRGFEEDVKQFPQPSKLDAEMPKIDGYLSSSRMRERASHISGTDSGGRMFERSMQGGFDHDGRFKSDGSLPGGNAGSHFPSLDIGDGQRLQGFRDDNLGNKKDTGHSNFHGSGPDFIHHHDGRVFGSPGRDFTGLPSSRLGLGGHSRLDDFPERDLRGLDERSRLFNRPSPSGMSNQYLRNEFGGPRNEFGNMPTFLPGHLKNEPGGPGENMRVGDRPLNLGNMESVGPMHFGESVFRSSFLAQGGSIQSDSFDQTRKRMFGSTGWCRICKIDCETVEGLDLHSQTREHQKIAMDVVLSIKQESAKKKKLSVEDNGLLDEKNKTKKVNPDGHKIKH